MYRTCCCIVVWSAILCIHLNLNNLGDLSHLFCNRGSSAVHKIHDETANNNNT